MNSKYKCVTVQYLISFPYKEWKRSRGWVFITSERSIQVLYTMRFVHKKQNSFEHVFNSTPYYTKEKALFIRMTVQMHASHACDKVKSFRD